MKVVRIGSGAGYSGDRIEPAIELAEKGDINYLCFECLAERTIALAQQEKQKDTRWGFDPLLERRLRAVLPICASKGIKIVTNMGAANPIEAAIKAASIAKEIGLDARVAAVTGDDVQDRCRDAGWPLLAGGGTVRGLGERLISANAYLGAGPIVDALNAGAGIVITGRASDAALFLAPLIKELGWAMDDWDRLAAGILAGHLLECAGQVTGGYFADPGYKDVPGLASLGFPIGEITQEGDVTITKVEGSGGIVTEATCKEQLIYEIGDPENYMQPDVIADFSQVTIEQAGLNRVLLRGARGKPRPPALKVSVGYRDGYIGEGQISYAGPGAVERGRLALEIVRERLWLNKVAMGEARFSLIGLNEMHGDKLAAASEPWEVRVRVAARTATLAEAKLIGAEVETLYTNGPAGGGGAFKSAREIVAVDSVLMPRELAVPAFQFVEG